MPTIKIQDGIQEVKAKNWNEFSGAIDGFGPDFLFRGQRVHSWNLDPSLTRLIKRLKLKAPWEGRIEKHLESFRYAVRGRATSPEREPHELWALGQHYGLATPLLDWTRSPFVAAYFAFSEVNTGKGNKANRAIFVLNELAVKNKSAQLSEKEAIKTFIPLSQDNYRLLSQNGVFTHVPVGYSIEGWIKQHFKGEAQKAVLTKILVPSSTRAKFLLQLDRMNINHLTLFPDLEGSSKYCNYKLEL